MGSVDDYLAALPTGAERTELERLRQVIAKVVPEVGQGVSYGMPCYLYRGKPVVATMVAKAHLAWYPYSGQVIRQVAELAEFDQSPGTLRFSATRPIPDASARRLLELRMEQIDHALDAH